MKSISEIVVEPKDKGCDWRAFIYCRDEDGYDWELRACGSSAQEAFEKVLARFNDCTEDWDIYGYPLTHNN
jgi:hypothetical protein